MSRTRVAAHVAALLLACMRADPVGQSAQTTGAVDREYVLDATMLGYRGVGGEIDGVRNPTLWARSGETVRITIINGEVMVHDVVLEKLGPRPPGEDWQPSGSLPLRRPSRAASGRRI